MQNKNKRPTVSGGSKGLTSTPENQHPHHYANPASGSKREHVTSAPVPPRSKTSEGGTLSKNEERGIAEGAVSGGAGGGGTGAGSAEGTGLNDEDLPEPEDLERVKNGGGSSSGSGGDGGKKGDVKAMAAGKAGNVRVVHPSWEGFGTSSRSSAKL